MCTSYMSHIHIVVSTCAYFNIYTIHPYIYTYLVFYMIYIYILSNNILSVPNLYSLYTRSSGTKSQNPKSLWETLYAPILIVNPGLTYYERLRDSLTEYFKDPLTTFDVRGCVTHPLKRFSDYAPLLHRYCTSCAYITSCTYMPSSTHQILIAV